MTDQQLRERAEAFSLQLDSYRAVMLKIRGQIRSTCLQADDHAPYALIEWKELIAMGHAIDAALNPAGEDVK